MRLALVSSAWALGFACVAFGGCSHSNDRNVQSRPYQPTAAEQRRIDERRAEDRRAEERRAEDRLADERRAEDRRAAERRAEDERRRSIGGGPNEPAIRATPASAVASIATARCDREVRCKNIGRKEKYGTRADCVADLQRDRRDDLNSDVCPGGIREKQLNDCLQSIRDEDCGNPLEAISRLNACRSGNLCAK
jgi:hypothetical protein